MQPVPNPPESASPGVDKVAASSNPPVLADISDSIHRLNSIQTSQANKGDLAATDDDLAHAQIHLHRLLTSATASDNNAVPPAVQHLANEIKGMINEMKDELVKKMDDLQGDMKSLQGDMRSLEDRVGESIILSSRIHNKMCGNGSDQPYQVFLSAEGYHPVTGKAALPALLSAQNIRDLDDDELGSYAEFYELAVDGLGRKQKLQMLCKHIGCSVRL